MLAAPLITANQTALGMTSSSSRQSIFSDNPDIRAAQESFGYADAVIAGDTIYFSGIVAFLAEGEDDISQAFARTFDRFSDILGRLGLEWKHVVAIDSFHMDLGGHSEIFKEVKNRYIKPPFPVWTAVGVTQLARPTSLAEIKITAWRG